MANQMYTVTCYTVMNIINKTVSLHLFEEESESNKSEVLEMSGCPVVPDDQKVYWVTKMYTTFIVRCLALSSSLHGYFKLVRLNHHIF